MIYPSSTHKTLPNVFDDIVVFEPTNLKFYGGFQYLLKESLHSKPTEMEEDIMVLSIT